MVACQGDSLPGRENVSMARPSLSRNRKTLRERGMPVKRLVLVLRLWLPSVRIVPGQSWSEALRCAEIIERKAVR